MLAAEMMNDFKTDGSDGLDGHGCRSAIGLDSLSDLGDSVFSNLGSETQFNI